MNQNVQQTAEQAAAFQKLWMESMSRMVQAALTFTPGSPPPEVLRQIRTGIFQALAESWDQFMRSPEFAESMKQWMENAIAFRKMSNDFMAKVRNELQSPSRDDIDTIMLTVRHMEKRLLDRIDELSQQVADLKQGAASARAGAPGAKRKTAKPAARTGGNGKGARV